MAEKCIVKSRHMIVNWNNLCKGLAVFDKRKTVGGPGEIV